MIEWVLDQDAGVIQSIPGTRKQEGRENLCALETGRCLSSLNNMSRKKETRE